MKKILIAGGTGHIGSFLTDKLSDYDITSFGSKHCDLTSKKSIQLFFSKNKKFDIIIFLVGLAHNKGKKNDFEEFNKLNYESLKNLFDFFKFHKIVPDQIIYGSTISVYGENLYCNNYSENSPKNPKSPYAVTKLKAEDFLIKNFKNKSWILRFAPCYSNLFLKNIYRRIKINNFYFIVSDGTKKLSLCNFENIKASVEGIITKHVPFGVYNVSDSINYSYKDLLELKKPSKIIVIPRIVLKSLFFLGKFFKNFFLIENTIKLLSNNVYSPNKINRYVSTQSSIGDLHIND